MTVNKTEQNKVITGSNNDGIGVKVREQGV